MSGVEELREVMALLDQATPGPWRWSENGNILGHMPDGYDESREVCAVYTDDEATGAPNAPAIIAAVNWVRTHAPALLERIAALEGERRKAALWDLFVAEAEAGMFPVCLLDDAKHMGGGVLEMHYINDTDAALDAARVGGE